MHRNSGGLKVESEGSRIFIIEFLQITKIHNDK